LNPVVSPAGKPSNSCLSLKNCGSINAMRGLFILAGLTWSLAAHAAVSEDLFYQTVTKKLIAHEQIDIAFLHPALTCAGNVQECRSPEQVTFDAIVNLMSDPKHTGHVTSELLRFKESESTVDSVEGFLYYKQLNGPQQRSWK